MGGAFQSVVELPNPSPLPPDLPAPIDDGRCAHLAGMRMPDLRLPTTAGRTIDLRQETAIPTVIFFYPRTGEPGSVSSADWDMIPGARGCHHHFCGFRNIHEEFLREGFKVFAASSQDTVYQKEFVERMHIPFEAISDELFRLTDALNLPTFAYRGLRLISRLSLILDKETIVHVFYPIFPPDKNAEIVLQWIRENRVR
jgi:peroxiredoxin